MKLKLALTPAALNATGLASAVAYSGGGYALGAAGPADALGHLVTIAGIAATNHSGKTFTITGTDADGIALTDTIAGPNGAVTVTSTYHFATVTSVTVSATTGADTFNIGWSAVAVTQTVVTDWRENQMQISLALVITGTVSVTVQHTLDNVRDVTQPDKLNWLPHSTLAAKTASADGNYAYPITAARMLVNSVTAGATVAFYILQGMSSA